MTDRPSIETRGPDAPEMPGEKDPWKDARENVDRVLSDGFMIFLALLMVPIIIIPMLVPDIDQQYLDFLDAADLGILVVFYLEYFLKLALARDRVGHFINGWHLLDLVIILLPLMELFPFLSPGLARRSPLLRLLRLARLMAVGSRSVKRRMGAPAPAQAAVPAAIPMTIQVVDKDLSTVRKGMTIAELRQHWESPDQTWIDISGISEEDLLELSGIIGIPPIVLTSKLVDESYPRIDYLERQSVIFLQIGASEVRLRGSGRFIINRTGLLIVCSGQNIMTISKQSSDLFEDVLRRARQQFGPDQPLLVSVLYSILDHIIGRYKMLIAEGEEELLRLESIPRGQTPRDFLETTFQLKREVNRLVSSLLHLKEVLTVIMNRRVPLEGFDRAHEELFDILADETVYLHETAQNSKDDLNSLIELYINTTSYATNRVMKVIAVITSLAIIPAFITGMLGMNLLGIPANLLLWQVMVFTLAVMAGIAYIFIKLGWLKS